MKRNHLFLRELRKLFDLRQDMDELAEIDANIHQGVQVRGTNLWILVFAIFVASIGLNVNSTAVIIGAMLISPLMGPIMGIGYGAGIDDFQLIRQSIRSLGTFVLISLVASTLYFFLTPLTQAQSELLARTSPNLWDVLIALFGGMAGIIAVTRQEKSNVIAGVAIATALMPPLCTAGYGIATGSPKFFFGAFYLFTINTICIALSSLLFTRILRIPRKSFSTALDQKRTHLIISAAIILTVVPSAYLALQLVKHEVFKTQANNFLTSISKTEKGMLLIQRDINPDNMNITVTIAGRQPDKESMERINARLEEFNLKDSKLIINSFQQDNNTDWSLVKNEMQQDLYRNSLQLLENKNAKIQDLEKNIRNLKQEQRKRAERMNEYEQIQKELIAQYPEILNVLIAHGRSTISSNINDVVLPIVDNTNSSEINQDQAELPNIDQLAAAQVNDTELPPIDTMVVYLETKGPMSKASRNRIRNWLKAHSGLESIHVFSRAI